eukprot:TRINITY_DN4367_c0_g1_i3.p1 TRINITY_DN4367_c0_g1~~TRINITY_DN4367_c0_g1_i3.p1  ORF type:complete len:994 (+),score=242.15 TRINITY_DN4367_c0_g1_i3:115-2982(+)
MAGSPTSPFGVRFTSPGPSPTGGNAQPTFTSPRRGSNFAPAVLPTSSSASSGAAGALTRMGTGLGRQPGALDRLRLQLSGAVALKASMAGACKALAPVSGALLRTSRSPLPKPLPPEEQRSEDQMMKKDEILLSMKRQGNALRLRVAQLQGAVEKARNRAQELEKEVAELKKEKEEWTRVDADIGYSGMCSPLGSMGALGRVGHTTFAEGAEGDELRGLQRKLELQQSLFAETKRKAEKTQSDCQELSKKIHMEKARLHAGCRSVLINLRAAKRQLAGLVQMGQQLPTTIADLFPSVTAGLLQAVEDGGLAPEKSAALATAVKNVQEKAMMVCCAVGNTSATRLAVNIPTETRQGMTEIRAQFDSSMTGLGAIEELLGKVLDSTAVFRDAAGAVAEARREAEDEAAKVLSAYQREAKERELALQQALDNEKARADARFKAATSERIRIAGELTSLREKVAKFDRKPLPGSREEVEADLHTAREQNERLEKQAEDLRAEATQLSEELNSTEEQLREAQAERDSLEERLKEAQAHADNLRRRTRRSIAVRGQPDEMSPWGDTTGQGPAAAARRGQDPPKYECFMCRWERNMALRAAGQPVSPTSPQLEIKWRKGRLEDRGGRHQKEQKMRELERAPPAYVRLDREAAAAAGAGGEVLTPVKALDVPVSPRGSPLMGKPTLGLASVDDADITPPRSPSRSPPNRPAGPYWPEWRRPAPLDPTAVDASWFGSSKCGGVRMRRQQRPITRGDLMASAEQPQVPDPPDRAADQPRAQTAPAPPQLGQRGVTPAEQAPAPPAAPPAAGKAPAPQPAQHPAQGGNQPPVFGSAPHEELRRRAAERQRAYLDWLQGGAQSPPPLPGGQRRGRGQGRAATPAPAHGARPAADTSPPPRPATSLMTGSSGTDGDVFCLLGTRGGGAAVPSSGSGTSLQSKETLALALRRGGPIVYITPQPDADQQT